MKRTKMRRNQDEQLTVMGIPSSWRMRAARVQATSLEDMATDSHRSGSAIPKSKDTKKTVRIRCSVKVRKKGGGGAYLG